MSKDLSQLLTELADASLADWECIAPLSGWPQEQNAIYKLFMRRIGTRRWWRIEDEVARVHSSVDDGYPDARSALRLSAEALAILRPERPEFRTTRKRALITVFEQLRPRLQPILCGPYVVPRATLLDLIAVSN